VTAIEFDAELAARATANFARTPHVRAVHGDGTRVVFEPADVIYVNAGATRPADAWLEELKEGGKLILPLTRGRISEPRRSAWGRLPDRATRLGIFRAPDLRGRDLFPVRGVVTWPASVRWPPLSTRAAPNA